MKRGRLHGLLFAAAIGSFLAAPPARSQASGSPQPPTVSQPPAIRAMTSAERAEYDGWVAGAAEAFRLQQFAEAQRLLELVLAREEATFGPEHVEVAGTLLWLGRTSTDARAALGYLRRAASLFDRFPDRVFERAMARVIMSQILRRSLDSDDVIPLLREALALATQAWGERDRRTLDIMQLLSKDLYWRRGPEARALLDREIALRTELFGIQEEDTLSAMLLRAQARQIDEPEGDDFPVLRRRLFQLTLEHWNGRTAAATDRLISLARRLVSEPGGSELVAAAIERVRGAEGDHRMTLVTLLAIRGHHAALQRDFAPAETLLRQEIDLASQIPDAAENELQWAAHYMGYILLLQRERRSEALPYVRRYRDSRRAERAGAENRFRQDEDGYYSWRGGQTESVMFLNALWHNAAPGEEMTEEAFEAIQQATTGQASRAVARSEALADAQAAGAGALVARRDELSWGYSAARRQRDRGDLGDSPQDRAEASRRREAVTRLERELDATEAELRRVFPAYFEFVAETALTREQAKNLLRPDEAVLYVVPGIYGTISALVTRERIYWHWDEIDMRTGWRTINGLRRDLECREAQCSYDRTTAFDLYRRIVSPFAAALEGKRHLFVIAEEAFGIFPFGALVTAPPQGRDSDPAALRSTAWFSDAHAIMQMPSIRALALQRRANRPPPARSGFAGFGAPDLDPVRAQASRVRRNRSSPAQRALEAAPLASTPFGQRRTGEAGRLLASPDALRVLPSLASTVSELQALRTALGAPARSVRTGRRATETAARSADLSNVRVIVFATHASLSEEFGVGEPGLVLTPPAQASDADDGLLVTSEIVRMRLNADWVILSACNTGRSGRGGESLSGLARAFFFAGARTLMVSHWVIRDELAPLMTVRTVEIDRDQPERSRAEALQLTMQEVRNNPLHPEYAHPGVWAAFTLVGDATR